MFEQSKLRDLTWICANSRIDCDAIFPCFAADGTVRQLLVVTSEWGWLVAPPGRLTRQGNDLQFAGPLEELFKLSSQAVGRLEGLFHFDPQWSARTAELEPAVREAVIKTNLVGARVGRLAVSQVVYDDGLSRVERVEVGAALWRRPLSGAALTEWLRSSPAIGSAAADGLADGGVCEPQRADRAALYVPGDTALKAIAPSHRVGVARAALRTTKPVADSAGRRAAGPGQSGEPLADRPAPPRTAVIGTPAGPHPAPPARQAPPAIVHAEVEAVMPEPPEHAPAVAPEPVAPRTRPHAPPASVADAVDQAAPPAQSRPAHPTPPKQPAQPKQPKQPTQPTHPTPPTPPAPDDAAANDPVRQAIERIRRRMGR